MRFFIGVCFVCLIVASVGCMTNNWSSPLFHNSIKDEAEDRVERPDFFHQTFGMQSGTDDRARRIEKSLGYED